MAYHFYRDDEGDLRAQTGRKLRLLGHFLEADIQDSRPICEEALEALDDLAAGRLRRWQMTGNAHTLTAFKLKSRIHAESGRVPDLVLPTGELRLALLEWELMLSQKPPRRIR